MNAFGTSPDKATPRTVAGPGAGQDNGIDLGNEPLHRDSNVPQVADGVVALVRDVTYGSYVNYGDTVRIRDHHIPYIDVTLSLSRQDRERGIQFANLRIVKLGEPVSADVHDQFDARAYAADTALAPLEPGSIIEISGRLYENVVVGSGGSELHYGVVFRSLEQARPDLMVPVDPRSCGARAVVDWSGVNVASPESSNPLIKQILERLRSHDTTAVEADFFS